MLEAAEMVRVRGRREYLASPRGLAGTCAEVARDDDEALIVTIGGTLSFDPIRDDRLAGVSDGGAREL